MKIYSRIFTGIVAICTSIITCFAQSSSFVQFGVEHGLVQCQVKTMVQDNDGQLWLGTIAGLSVYNGIEFKTITKNDGLIEDWVTTLFKDKIGNIWCGHWGGGITIYKYKEKQFSPLMLEEILEYKSISTIYEDKNDLIWIGTEGAGICVYDPQKNTYINLDEEQGLSSNEIFSITNDSRGNIWCGTSNGITRFDPFKIVDNLKNKKSGSESQKDLLLKLKYFKTEAGLPHKAVISLLHTNKNKIIAGTPGNGLAIFDENYDEGNFKVVLADESLYAVQYIKHLFEDVSGNVWASTETGVAEISSFFIESAFEEKLSDNDADKYVKIFNTQKGLNFSKVNYTIQDREKNIWVATEIGINLYRGEKFLLFDEKDGLSHSLVWDIHEDPVGNIWFATENGVTVFNNGKIEHLNISNELYKNSVLKLCQSANYIWIGTRGGCSIYSLTQKKLITIEKVSEQLKRRAHTLDYDGRFVWIGTDDGLYSFDEQTEKLQKYDENQGLASSHISVVRCDSRGYVWISALGADLTMYDGNEFKTFGESYGLKRKLIFCIEEDLSGNIWIGTYGSGVYRLSFEKDSVKIKNYSIKEGLSGATSFLLLCDNTNNMWVGTSLGIDKIDQNTNIIKHYGKKEGFQGIETAQGAVCRDKKGNLWFGTIMGAVKYDSEKDLLNETESVTLISEILINKKKAPFPEKAIFNYDQDNISFHCKGISLTNPEKVLYKYYLEGLDTEWSPPTNSQFAEYTNLSHGTYRFKVITCNNDGLWNKVPVFYDFKIFPPFWRTWWFYLIASSAIAGLFYSMYTLRIRNLRKAQIVLAEQVDLRTRELNEEKEKLELAKQDIESKNKKLWQINLSVLSEKDKAEKIKKLLEEKNTHITDSIKYAMRIQKAILPTETTIKGYLPASFIIYEPKDIVSGDFYWFYHAENKIYLAAVDCTGHGVPGAFMSLIGYTLLNQIVGENKIYEPSKILSMLDIGIKKSLHQYKEGAEAMDGMDLALIEMDMNSKKLFFCGALRPLFVSKSSGVEEIKGNRFSIGGHEIKGGKQFNQVEVTYKKGDKIYLFSDGVTDQFGGSQGRKYTKKQLRDFIASNYHLHFSEHQKSIKKEMNAWRGTYEQTDDVMAIGIEL